MTTDFTHRVATFDDIPAIHALMDRAIHDLQQDFLSPEQIEASYELMGLDTQLIDDGTYFVIEAKSFLLAPQAPGADIRPLGLPRISSGGHEVLASPSSGSENNPDKTALSAFHRSEAKPRPTENNQIIVGCGGWSWRNTLFGANHTKGRDASALDPKVDPARVRAMYTHPDWARQGIGKRIILICENAARNAGFKRTRLAATLAGFPLYKYCGYSTVEPFEAIASNGVAVPLITMEKTI